MARCETGYLCDICGLEVEGLEDSALYLGYVLGDVSPEELAARQERHLACEPTLAQFINDPSFAPVSCHGPFAKEQLDAEFVSAETKRVTRGWQRLRELPGLGLTVPEYPLPEVIARWAQKN